MKQNFISKNRYFHNNSRSFISSLILVSLLFLLPNCIKSTLGVPDIIKEIEKTRNSIVEESGEWRGELSKLKNQLDGMESRFSADLKGILNDTTNQVQDLTTQTINLTDAKAETLLGQAESSVFCTADFIKEGTVEQLEYIIEDLKFWIVNETHLAKKPAHHVCIIAPNVLHLYPSENNWLIEASNMEDANIVKVFGYNFWADNVPSLELQDAGGNTLRPINLKAAYVTHYQINLDFAEEKFPDTKPGQRLVFRWPDHDEPNTINLALAEPAKLRLSNSVFSLASPIAGIDPVTLQVTITNVGGSRSGNFEVIWKPDPNDNRTLSVNSPRPLEPKESITLSFPDPYVFQQDGQITMRIALMNGDDAIDVPLTVQPNIWIVDAAGVCRDNVGEYPRWSHINWSLSKCEANCRANPNCQGFAMSKTETYCQLIGSDGEFEGSRPNTYITRGDSSHPQYTCYLKAANLSPKIWVSDPRGVCRDNDGGHPRWSAYNWPISKCEANCRANPNCQGFAMSKTETYCQLIGSDGEYPGSGGIFSASTSIITHGDSSQPQYTCYLKVGFTK